MLCCPAPLCDTVRDDLQRRRRCAGRRTAPRGRRAYWDIWLDGEKIETLPPAGRAAQVPTPGDDPVEPIYGKTYLPRKFKTAFALPEDNCTDIHANDLGFLASSRTGGSSATTSWSAAAWARPPAPEDVSVPGRAALLRRSRPTCCEIGEAVLKVFRDFGNRSDRKRARLKYIIHDWGLPAFRAKVEEYLGHPLADPEAGDGHRASTITWAGTRRATASSSWAFRSRTAGSGTRATIGWPAACGRSSRNTRRRRG